MDKKTDVRVIKTKAKLNKAFRQLLVEKGYVDITVNEICIRAGVRRATFYKHYDDKLSFLSGVANDLISSLDALMETRIAVTDSKSYLINFEKSLMGCLFEAKQAGGFTSDEKTVSAVASVLVRAHYEFLKSKLDEIVRAGVELIADPSIVAAMISGGIANVMVGSYNAPEIFSEARIYTEIDKIIAVIFKQ